MSLFKQRCIDIDNQLWSSGVVLFSKLDFYRQFKKAVSFEIYLNVIKVKEFRVNLCRFRCSNHNLMIESGRHLGLKRDDRLCPFCIIPSVENEFHFCLVCPFYTQLRTDILPRYYNLLPSELKLIQLFESTNEHVVNSLARDLFFAMKKRNKFLQSV